jgi:protease IV
MTDGNNDNIPTSEPITPEPIKETEKVTETAQQNTIAKKKSSALYIILGIFCVIGLFVISAVVNTWSSVKNTSANWKPSAVFSKPSGGEAIVALDVDGIIFGSKDLLEAVAQIEDNSSVKGVVLRINSPGGAVAPTQEILGAINRLVAKKITVYCSFADIAASGGYYLATACSKIFTNPGTLTGSIGVIMPFANLQELYKFIKVEPMVIKAGRFKDIGSESRPMTSDERILLQNMADEIHRQFKTSIKESRKLSDEIIQEYADGRIFLGTQAIDYGFADELGGEFETTAALAKALDIKAPTKLTRYPTPKPQFRSLFGVLSSLTGKDQKPVTETSQILEWIGSKAPELHPMLSSGVPYFLPYSWFSKK